MALPSGPIPLVATGEIIEETWGDSVAQSLNNLAQHNTWAVWNPGSGDEFLADTAGLMTNWFTVGGATPTDLFIPDWAEQAFVTYTITGVQYRPTSPGHNISYLLQAQFGPLEGRLVRFTGQGGWFGMSWADQFLSIEDAVGDRHIRIKAQRLEGSGSDSWAFFDQSDIGVDIRYYNPIDLYPGL